jgi:hypothetical protein
MYFIIIRNPYDNLYAYKTQNYDEKLNKLFLPYDSNTLLYQEFEGFNTQQQNQETWVPFLNYPLDLNIGYEQKKKILDTYGQVIYSIKKKKSIC